MTTSLKILRPVAITTAMLTACTVPEDDYPTHNMGTTYGEGEAYRVIDTTTHMVYQSAAAANTGHAPATSPTWWTPVRPTNRWAMFDQSNTTTTTAATSMSYTIKTGRATTGVCLLGLVGGSVRVRVTVPGYGTTVDKTISLRGYAEANWWSYLFGERMPTSVVTALDVVCPSSGSITLDFVGTTVGCATCLIGQVTSIGTGVAYGATLGIQDYSRKETNDFGDMVFVERAFAKLANFKVTLPADTVDFVGEFLTSIRAKPVLYIGTSTYTSTTVYGTYESWETSIDNFGHSNLNIKLKGLT